MKMRASIGFSFLALTTIVLCKGVMSKRLMYVWDKEFVANEESCGVSEAKSESQTCLKAVHIEKLVHACKHAEVSRVLFSFPQAELQRCDSKVVNTVRALHEAGIQVHQLYAESTPSFGEKKMVSEVSKFNDNCAAEDQRGMFDGVAVNNEAFEKCCGDDCGQGAIEQMTAFVNNVRIARDLSRPLPFHFSIAWHWGVCGSEPLEIEYEGKTQSVTQHLIDIVDSVDVQVAWSEASEMIRRAKIAGYDHSHGDTSFFVLAYTNAVPNDDCRLTFFPYQTECAVGESTERGLFSELSKIEASLPHANGGIHYYSNAYFSGLPGWKRDHIARIGRETDISRDSALEP